MGGAVPGDQERSGRLEAELATAVEPPFSELDRGQVALAYCSQTHHEPAFAGRKPGLIGPEHDRWVEQRGGLDRVLVAEVGAHQQAPLTRQSLDRFDVVGHELEVPFQDRWKVSVPRRKSGQDLG